MHEEGVTNKLPNDVGTTQARRCWIDWPASIEHACWKEDILVYNDVRNGRSYVSRSVQPTTAASRFDLFALDQLKSTSAMYYWLAIAALWTCQSERLLDLTGTQKQTRSCISVLHACMPVDLQLQFQMM